MHVVLFRGYMCKFLDYGMLRRFSLIPNQQNQQNTNKRPVLFSGHLIRQSIIHSFV
jgi:hypothetical protein